MVFDVEGHIVGSQQKLGDWTSAHGARGCDRIDRLALIPLFTFPNGGMLSRRPQTKAQQCDGEHRRYP